MVKVPGKVGFAMTDPSGRPWLMAFINAVGFAVVAGVFGGGGAPASAFANNSSACVTRLATKPPFGMDTIALDSAFEDTGVDAVSPESWRISLDDFAGGSPKRCILPVKG